MCWSDTFRFCSIMTITSKHSIYCFPALGSIRMKFVPGGSLPHREIKKPYNLCGLITLSEIIFPCLTVNVYSFALLKCACQMAVYSYLLPLEEILWPWRGGGGTIPSTEIDLVPFLCSSCSWLWCVFLKGSKTRGSGQKCSNFCYWLYTKNVTCVTDIPWLKWEKKKKQLIKLQHRENFFFFF